MPSKRDAAAIAATVQQFGKPQAGSAHSTPVYTPSEKTVTISVGLAEGAFDELEATCKELGREAGRRTSARKVEVFRALLAELLTDDELRKRVVERLRK